MVNAALGEAVALLHLLVARVAEDSGIRVLFIKGPILTMQGLRPERPSVDVDVLVDSSRFEDMQAQLREHGWRIDVPSTGAHVMTFHSKTYRHDNWPCEIDVHDRFPGFLADPQVVFEALWARRTNATIASRQVPCPDLLGNAAIAALHALRDPSYERSRRDLAFMVQTLRQRLDQNNLLEFAELAAVTGATETLRPFLDELGVPHLGADSTLADDLRAWRIRTSSTGVKAVPYLYQLGRLPMRKRPALLWHALVLPEVEIRKTQPHAEPGAWGLFKARLRRLGWALKDLPEAARIIREASKDGQVPARQGGRRKTVST